MVRYYVPRVAFNGLNLGVSSKAGPDLDNEILNLEQIL